MRFRDAGGNEYQASDVVGVHEVSETSIVETDGFYVPYAEITQTYRLKSDGREVNPIQESKDGGKVQG